MKKYSFGGFNEANITRVDISEVFKWLVLYFFIFDFLPFIVDPIILHMFSARYDPWWPFQEVLFWGVLFVLFVVYEFVYLDDGFPAFMAFAIFVCIDWGVEIIIGIFTDDLTILLFTFFIILDGFEINEDLDSEDLDDYDI